MVFFLNLVLEVNSLRRSRHSGFLGVESVRPWREERRRKSGRVPIRFPLWAHITGREERIVQSISGSRSQSFQVRGGDHRFRPSHQKKTRAWC